MNDAEKKLLLELYKKVKYIEEAVELLVEIKQQEIEEKNKKSLTKN
jgi:hypothetical protein